MSRLQILSLENSKTARFGAGLEICTTPVGFNRLCIIGFAYAYLKLLIFSVMIGINFALPCYLKYALRFHSSLIFLCAETAT